MADDEKQVPDLKRMTSVLVFNLRTSGLILDEALRAIKTEFIIQELFACKGNQCKAARALGRHRNTLQRDLQQLKIPISGLTELAKRRTRIA